MKTIQKLLVSVLFLCLLSSFAYAVAQISYIVVDDSNAPVTGVDVLGYVCTSANCASVSGGISTWTQNPYNTGGLNTITLSYPTTLQNANGYAIYFYKDGYIPYEEPNNWYGTGSASSPVNPYHMTKKTNCNSPLTTSVTSTDHEQIDVTVTSAITMQNNGVTYIPPAYQDYYEVNTSVTLNVFNSSSANIYTESKSDTILYSANSVFQFNWTPPYDDQFSYIATSDPVDPQCYQSSKQLVNSTTATSDVSYATSPVISNVQSNSITNQSAVITWTTDKMSNSTVKYGTISGNYPSSNSTSIDVTSHSVSISGLTANTTYFYVVNSSNSSIASAQSGEFIFTTLITDLVPVVNLISPDDGNYTTNHNVTFICNASDESLVSNITLYTNITGSWSANYTNTSGNQIEYTIYNISNGVYSWNCLAYDNTSNTAWAPTNRTLTINYTEPDYPPVTIQNVPLNNHIYNTSTLPIEVVFNCSATDDNNLQNMSLYLTGNLNSSFAFNSSIALNGISNTTTWTINLTNGTYSWNCLTFDNNSQSDWGENRTLFINYNPIMYNITINEFLANNGTEFIELYNNENFSIDIGNWQIDDTIGGGSAPDTIPAGTTINASGFFVHYTSGFLNNGGDNISLLNDQGVLMNSYEYTSDPGAGQAIGRYTDGSLNWVNVSIPTPNSSNIYDIVSPNVSLISVADNSRISTPNVTLSCNATNHNLQNLSLWINSTGTWHLNQTENVSGTFNESSFNMTDLPDGLYTWNCQAYDVYGNNAFAQDNWTFTVDTTAPMWGNNATSPNSSIGYVSGADYQFNVTWNDINGIDTVYFENNFTGTLMNESASGNNSNEYYYNVSDLGAGTYIWRSYANDSLGNWNITDEWEFVVMQAASVVNLTLNGTDGDMNISYGDIANITGSLLAGQGNIEIFDNNSNYASGSNSLERLWQYNETGYYNITIRYNETQNYTANQESHIIGVYDWNSPIVELIDEQDNYVSAIPNITLSCNATDYALKNISLWINSTGTWHLNQSNDVSGRSNQSEFNITDLPDGKYMWNCEAYDTTSNSSFASANRTFTIDASAPMWSNNATSPNSESVYDPNAVYEFNVTWSDIFNVSSVWFRHNFTGSFENYTEHVQQGNNYTYNWTGLAAGTYAWRSYANDTAGNINMTDEFEFIVNKAPSEVNLTFNDINGDIIINTSEIVNITGYLNTGQGNLSLFDNSSGLIGMGPTPFIILRQYNDTGVYNITLIYNETQNYTANFENHTITVVDNVPPVVNLSSIADESRISNPNVTLSCSATNHQLQNLSLWINSTGTWHLNQTENVSGTFNESRFNMTELSDGIYTWNCQAYDVYGNNAFAADNWTFTIDTTAPMWSNNATSPNSGAVYDPNAVYEFNVTWSDIFNVSSVWFKHNFTGSFENYTEHVQQGNNYTYNWTGLAAGTYAWRSYANDTAGNINMTDEFEFIVNKAPSEVNLTLNGTNANITYPAYDDINITALLAAPSTGDIRVYNNGTLMHNSSSPYTELVQFNRSGLYNITAYYDTTQNYTSNFSTYFINVTGDVIVVDSNVKGINFTNGTYTALDLNASIYRSTLNISNTTGSVLEINDSYIYNSNITNSKVFNCTILDSIFMEGTCQDSFIDPSSLIGTNVTGNSNITDSHVWYSSIDDTNITDSTIDNSTVNSSVVLDSNATSSTIIDSESYNSVFENSTADSLTANNTNMSDSTITSCILINSTINSSTLFNTNTTESTVISSTANNSVLDNSNVTSDSSIISSTISRSDVNNSNVTIGSSLTDSDVINSDISDSNLTSSEITSSHISSSNITLNSNVNDSIIYNSDIENSNITQDSNVTNSAVSGSEITDSNITAGSSISDSDVINSSVDDGDIIQNSTVISSIIDNSTIANSTINENSSIINSNTINATIENVTISSGSNVNDSTIIDSIIENTTISAGSNVTDSTVTDSIIEDSVISDGANVTNSNLDNATISSGSNVTDSTVTDSTIEDSVISNGANVTDSDLNNVTITDNSNVSDANINNSIINNTLISNTNITDSTITNVTIIDSVIENSTLSDTNVTNANITDDIIYNGTITLPDGNQYNATQNGSQSLTQVVNYAPIANFSTPSSASESTSVTITDLSTDSNEGSAYLNNTWQYIWDFGDGSNLENYSHSSIGGNNPSHTYSSTGNYTITLNVTDYYGESSTYNSSIEITEYVAPPASPSGGGGGSGGSSSSTTHSITLTDLGTSLWMSKNSRAVFDFNGEQHEVRIMSISSSSVTIRVASTPITAILNVFDEMLFDLDEDEDNTSDISITLEELQGTSKARLTIKTINEVYGSDEQQNIITRTEITSTGSEDEKDENLPKRIWTEEINVKPKDRSSDEKEGGLSSITGMFISIKEKIIDYPYSKNILAGIAILALAIICLQINKRMIKRDKGNQKSGKKNKKKSNEKTRSNKKNKNKNKSGKSKNKIFNKLSDRFKSGKTYISKKIDSLKNKK